MGGINIMEINTETKYSTNVEVTDLITGEVAVATLQAVRYSNSTIEGFICGIPYEQVKDTLNPQIETKYQEFIAKVAQL